MWYTCAAFIVVREHTVNALNHLKFVEACFVTPYMVNLGKCYIYVWKEHIFCYCWVVFFIYVMYIHTLCIYIKYMARYLDVLNLLMVLFRSSASLIFCFPILSAIERGVFKLLTVVVDLSILVPSVLFYTGYGYI